MIGPTDDDKYYCLGKEYGYCDRRSGTCFCNTGYKGPSCASCAPSHIKVGDLCYPIQKCPKDCSRHGTCDFVTGVCTCHDKYWYGVDCSKRTCQEWDEYCMDCNDVECLKCIPGYSVNNNIVRTTTTTTTPTTPTTTTTTAVTTTSNENNTTHSTNATNAEPQSQPEAQQQQQQHQHQHQLCQPCTRFDPRCRVCNAHQCLECIDLLLLSIRRAGPRPQDYQTPLPPDELERELSITVPFASLQTNAFDEAESYFLMEDYYYGDDFIPLKDRTVSCHQGYQWVRSSLLIISIFIQFMFFHSQNDVSCQYKHIMDINES